MPAVFLIHKIDICENLYIITVTEEKKGGNP